MAISTLSSRISLKNILFATDFSVASKGALPYALAFGRWYGAKIFVAHAIPREPQFSVPLDALPKEQNPYWRDAQQNLADFLSSAPFKDAQYEVAMEQGDLWQVISDIIQRNEIDLVVLGTHGRQGVRKLVLGSGAEEIFRMADCPVLTVGPRAFRPSAQFETFKDIVFATDFSPASLHALPYALSVAQENQASLLMLHLMELVPFQHQEAVRQDAIERLRGLLPQEADTWCKPEFVVGFQFAAEGILQLARERAADLIVMGVHKKAAPRVSAHLLWTTAYEVVCNANCPVLTVRG